MFRLLIFSILLYHSLGAQDLYDREHSRAFAEYLLKSGQYQLAALELERLQFIEPDNDSLKADLVRAYSLDRSFGAAIRTLNRFYPSADKLKNPFSSLYAYNLIELGRYQEASSLLSPANGFTTDQIRWYGGFSCLKRNDFKAAAGLFPLNDSIPPSLLRLKVLAAEGNAIRLKKPWLAGAMSTLVPGTGKFYTGDWKDALVSIVTIGLTGFQAYRGFSKYGSASTYGWIYTGLGTGFYLGNIYGSVASAKRANKRKLQRLKAKVDDAFSLHP